MHFAALQLFTAEAYFSNELAFYITADYLSPFLPFMLSTTGYALMLIVTCMYIEDKYYGNRRVEIFVKTGQITLTHYVAHLTIGFVIYMLLSGKNFSGVLNNVMPVQPIFILLFSTVYFVVSVLFSKAWKIKFKHGPLETLMRK